MTLSIPRTVKTSLTENLRDEILRGEIIPGQHLRLEEIAARFDVSTTPVREALRDLEAEGLVTIFPHRRAVVTKLSVQDIQDIYDVRATLESMATRLAVPNSTHILLNQMNLLIEQMDKHIGEVAVLVKLNHDFHMTLYSAANRRYLYDFIRMLRHRTQHYLHAFIADFGGMPIAQSEHRLIVEACQKRKVEVAASLIANHINQVGSSIIEYVQKQESAMNITR